MNTRILAIETSGRHGSIALLQGDDSAARVVGDLNLTGEGRTAQSLHPGIEQLLGVAGWSAASIGLVAVTIGPGSFTGLRIGVTAAKTIAYAVGGEVVGVDTLEVLASQVPASPAPLWAIIDAQRNELFAARSVERFDGLPLVDREPAIVAVDDWLAALHEHERVTGPALAKLASLLPPTVRAVPEEYWQPSAAAVGKLAWQKHLAGSRDDFWRLAPKYYRASAAEEKKGRQGDKSETGRGRETRR
jgi:tRNA threonylcarbamoyladenosine biosynthesis protein TsaB